MHYFNVGEKRGDCGHRHRTLVSATKCLIEDQMVCENEGHYSDSLTKVKQKKEIYELSSDEWRQQDKILLKSQYEKETSRC